MSRRLLILLALLMAAIMVSGCCCCCGDRRYFSPGRPTYEVTVVPVRATVTPFPAVNPTAPPAATIIPVNTT